MFVKTNGIAYISTFLAIFLSIFMLNLYLKFSLYNKIISIKATAKVIATRIAEDLGIKFENVKIIPKETIGRL